MPPISLRLDPTSYIVLHTVVQRSRNVLHWHVDDFRSVLAEPHVATIADMKLKDPDGIIFPKKGKQTRFTFSQVVCLQKILLELQQQNPAPALLLLISLFDAALLNYDARFGYRITQSPYRVV